MPQRLRTTLTLDHRLRWLAVWTVVGWLLLGSIVVFSLTPNFPLKLMRQYDKVVHMLAYGGVMLWFAQLYPQRFARLFWALAFVGMGIGLEVAQGMSRYRHFDWWDAGATAVGVSLACALSFTRCGSILLELESRILPVHASPRA